MSVPMIPSWPAGARAACKGGWHASVPAIRSPEAVRGWAAGIETSWKGNKMAEDATLPMQVLRQHATALEAALSVCLADPGHTAVHKLRPETRRVEAQLRLLAQVPELPEHRDDAGRLLRALKRLRRVAGEVRDLDVQRSKLEELADTAAAESKDAATEVDADTAEQTLAKGATKLRDYLKAKRADAASDLERLLRKRQAKTAGATEALLKTLESADEVSLPVSDLRRAAEAVFSRHGLLAKGDVAALTEDELHTVRKAAKTARYLAETLPGNPGSVEAAKHFEALQEAGGQWHDALDLARVARRHLGKGHPLAVALAGERDSKLEAYRSALGEEAQAVRPKQPAKQAAAQPRARRTPRPAMPA